MNMNAKSLIAVSIAATPLLISPAGAAGIQLTPIENLGKHVFFDPISIGNNVQGCFSCHDAGKGGVFPDSKVNEGPVVAPGASIFAQGNIKPPSNAYAFFSPRFQRDDTIAPPVPPYKGGNFWDGRAEGWGITGTPEGDTTEAGDTITEADLPPSKVAAYKKYLGPTADQALRPFLNNLEQNTQAWNVCQHVRTGPYSTLYRQAYGESINCSSLPKSNPRYITSYKRLAVALAAWQGSADLSSFSSKRDKAIAYEAKFENPVTFPLRQLTAQENLGHDIFYGITSDLNPRGANARCTTCHTGVPEGDVLFAPPNVAGPPSFNARAGTEPRQLYADNLYHNIGVPYNREMPAAEGSNLGLAKHVPVAEVPVAGEFRTPTLRNVSKGVSSTFTKAYTHNGWFKSLKSLVHFYNTRDAGPRAQLNFPGIAKCEDLNPPIFNATEKEALANNCWPKAEGNAEATKAGFVMGDLGLTDAEEDAIVAYLKTLDDEHTPTAP
ncbi:MAG: cytochrome c peroxidase [Pseudomonadota bacterium]